MKHIAPIYIAWAAPILLSASLHAGPISFTLAGDPNQYFSFTTAGGATVNEPVGPYPGYLGAQTPADLYGFLCIDYLKTANWNTSYSGFLYDVSSPVDGKSEPQLLEAAYLVSKLMWLGGASAATNLYQGPISFAVWQIMDPVTGHVPVNPAAQPYILEAQNAYLSGGLNAASFPNVRVFVSDNPSIQSFMTATAQSPFPEDSGVPEPANVALLAGGLALIGLARFRRARRPQRPIE